MGGLNWWIEAIEDDVKENGKSALTSQKDRRKNGKEIPIPTGKSYSLKSAGRLCSLLWKFLKIPCKPTRPKEELTTRAKLLEQTWHFNIAPVWLKFIRTRHHAL